MLNTANYQRNANQKYTSHESEWPSPKSVQTSAGEEIKKREASYTAGGAVRWCSHYGKQYECVHAELLQSSLTLQPYGL